MYGMGKKRFSSEIRVAALERDKSYCKALSTGVKQDWYKYKTERNSDNDMSRRLDILKMP